MNWITHSFRTVFLPFAALKIMISHRRIFFLCLIPLVISIVLAWFLGHWIQGLIWEKVQGFSYFKAADPHGFFYRFSYYLLTFLIGILAALCFNVIALIASAPFNDWISEETEKTLLPAGSPVQALSDVTKETTSLSARWFRLMWLDLKKAIFATIVQILLVLAGMFLFWIPAVPILVAIGLAWSVTFQFVSYPQTRKMQGLEEALGWIWQNPLQSFIYGSVFGTLLSIPLVSAFVLPIAVVAGTVLERRSRLSP